MAEDLPISYSCLCGAVECVRICFFLSFFPFLFFFFPSNFSLQKVSSTPALKVFCHCNSCRVYGGSPACVGGWKPTEWKLVKGQDNLINYESAPKKTRHSCKTCGSFINNVLPDGTVVVPLQGLKYPADFKGEKILPNMHIFYAERARDEPENDGLKRFDGWPQ